MDQTRMVGGVSSRVLEDFNQKGQQCKEPEMGITSGCSRDKETGPRGRGWGEEWRS